MITPALASAAIDCLDEVAVAMECKWGVGRLPKLVAPDLAAKFHAQAEKLDAAISMKLHDAIVAHASAMERAWKALDAAAAKVGAQPMAPTIWQTVIPSTGEVVAIVRTGDEAAAVAAERWGTVWTLAEIALALDAFGDDVRAVKARFPSATVTAVRPNGISNPPDQQKQAQAAKASISERAKAARQPKPSAPGFSPAEFNSPQRKSQGLDWAKGDDVPF
jgi:hypothetical protein